MLPTTPLLPAGRPAPAGRPPPALHGLHQAWQRVRQRALERASRRELHALSEATLRDLGIARSEIDGLAAAVAGRIEATHPRLAPRRPVAP